MYSIAVGFFSPTLYCRPNVTTIGEEVLYLQPMIPPKRVDISPPDWGMLRRSRRVLIFLKTTVHDGDIQMEIIALSHFVESNQLYRRRRGNR